MRTMRDSIKSKSIYLFIFGFCYAGSALAQFSDSAYQTTDGNTVQKTDLRSPPSGVVILNNNGTDVSSSSRARANSQPVTNVEASPVVNSRAGNLRKERENAEIDTEQRIVEKLESSRLEDEKRRADRLFGNRFSDDAEEKVVIKKEKEEVVIAPPPPPQPQPPMIPQQPSSPQVVIIQQQPQAAPVREETIVRPAEEIVPVHQQEVNETSGHVERENHQDELAPSQYYVSGLIGGLAYPGAENVQANAAYGVAIGKEYDTGMVLEGAFIYSNAYINNLWTNAFFTNLSQYSGVFSARYNFMRDWIRPYAGASIAYTYRVYSDRSYYGGGPLDSSISSQAIDLGFGGGADVMITDKFSVGGDIRYMFNLISMADNYYLSNNYADGSKPLEKSGYWTFMLTGKYHF